MLAGFEPVPPAFELLCNIQAIITTTNVMLWLLDDVLAFAKNDE